MDSLPDALRRRVQHGFDLSWPSLGDRRSWTVRLAHGVYLVRLDQSPLGNRLFVDGHEVARTQSWDFERPIPFDLGEGRGEVRFSADTQRGTLATQLVVEGRPVTPDLPRSQGGRLRPFKWKMWLERSGYAIGGALVLAGLVGDPVAPVVSGAIWTFAVLLWTSGLSAVDPFGIVPFAVDHSLAGRPSMIVAGAEVMAIAALACGRFGLDRWVTPVRARRWPVRVVGWIVVIGFALALIAVVS